jgi:hypothetical protein
MQGVGAVFLLSRGDWIRTSDLLLPKQALYRAKLRPDYNSAESGMRDPELLMKMRSEGLEPPTF